MTASNFAMRMLLSHSDFSHLYKQATSDIPHERDYAMQKLSELYDELLALVLKFDDEQEFDHVVCSLKDIQALATFLLIEHPYGEKTIEHVTAIADCQTVHLGNVKNHFAWHNQD